MRILFVLGACVGLVACGGSGGSDDPAAPTVTYDAASGFVGTFGSTITYDATTDAYTVVRGADTFVMAGNATFDIGTFDGGEDGVGNGMFTSTTDASSVSLVFLDGVGTSVQLARTVPTVAPTSGTATLTGDYAGLITDTTTNEVEWIISGDGSMTFDFGASTTEGFIANRQLRDPMTNAVVATVDVGQITLSQVTLSNDVGIYGGLASGGSIDLSSVGSSPTVTSSGSYSVFIAGDTADEAIGGVRMSHSPVGSSDSFRELGALALGH